MICTYSRSALEESGSGHVLPLRARLRHGRSTPRHRSCPDSEKQACDLVEHTSRKRIPSGPSSRTPPFRAPKRCSREAPGGTSQFFSPKGAHKQAAYLVRTTHEIALVGTGSRAHRATTSMERRPTRMPSGGSTRAYARDTLPCGGCPAPLESPDGRPGETRRLSALRGNHGEIRQAPARSCGTS